MYFTSQPLSTCPRRGIAAALTTARLALYLALGLGLGSTLLAPPVPAQRAGEATPPRRANGGLDADPRQEPPSAGSATQARGDRQDGQRQKGGFLLKEGEHDLRELVNRAAAFLHRNILMIETVAPLQATVRLQNALDLDEAGCEAVLSQLLYANGWALTPLDAARGTWELVHMSGPRRNDAMSRALHMSPGEVLRRDTLKVVVVTALPLQHVRATVATNALRPFFVSTATGTPALTIGNAGADNALLLQGFADSVAAAIRLVQAVDQADPRMTPSLEERLAHLEARLQALEGQVKREAAPSEAGAPPRGSGKREG